MPTYIMGGFLSFERPFSTLLRADGTEYAGGTIVSNMRIPGEQSNTIYTRRANNQMNLTEIGERFGMSDGFEVDVFQETAVAQIKADIGREAFEGVFIIERPGPPWDPSTPGIKYWVRFYAAPFEPQGGTRRGQRISWHKADMTGTPIEVLNADPL